jgi:hypothetical protein
MGAEVAAIILATRARQRRRIIDHFCAKHAVTPYDTILYKPPPELRRAFESLVADRLIRREGHAYYWLDINAWDAALARRQRRRVPLVVGATLLLALGLMLGFYRG